MTVKDGDQQRAFVYLVTEWMGLSFDLWRLCGSCKIALPRISKRAQISSRLLQ